MGDRELRRLFEERLRAGGVAADAIAAFFRMLQVYRGRRGNDLAWNEVSPPAAGDLVDLALISTGSCAETGRRNLHRLVWIVLNGGLGTSMAMERAKSLLPVKGGQTFLDLLARFVLSLRREWDVGLPLVFMHSFATRRDSLEALAGYPLSVRGGDGESLPLDFLQHRFPRIRERDGHPFGAPGDAAAWAPPGHGDLYLALASSGTLQRLLENGYRWAFVSNADNLGASPDPALLGFMAERGLDFALELTPKTAADVKGGTLIRRRGRLELLEVAQVPEGRMGEFQDIERFPVFNTNNLWLDLEGLSRALSSGAFDLPLIVNHKTVEGTPVVQLETAMGAAVGVFERTRGIRVPRSRFAPVKTTDDLLVRRSDAYVEGVRAPLEINPARDPGLGLPVVHLDRRFYRSVPDLEARIPVPPSLLEATWFEVVGDVRLGGGTTVRGCVRLENHGPQPLVIADGTVLSG